MFDIEIEKSIWILWNVFNLLLCACFQKNNIPKDYRIPLDYIPKATVSTLREQTHDSEEMGFFLARLVVSWADLATVVLRWRL